MLIGLAKFWARLGRKMGPFNRFLHMFLLTCEGSSFFLWHVSPCLDG
jgi:hypothetical protein